MINCTEVARGGCQQLCSDSSRAFEVFVGLITYGQKKCQLKLIIKTMVTMAT
jgi:hypothetical protein